VRQSPRRAASLHNRLEKSMPWYFWLILVVALGSIVGSLLMLRSTARKIPLTEEQKKRIAERNAEADAKDAQDR
jgi:hypothetical protein